MKARTNIFTSVFLGLLLGSGGLLAGTARTPQPGSEERTAIMDAARLDFYRNDPEGAHANPKGILFNVKYLKVEGDWALANLLPLQKGKECAEPRWQLVHMMSGKWIPINLIKGTNPPNDIVANDILNMSPEGVRILKAALPEAPPCIFP